MLEKREIILLYKIVPIASADCTAQPDTRPDEVKSVSVGPFNNLSAVCKLAFMCSVSCPQGSRFNFTDILMVTPTLHSAAVVTGAS